ncbi:MAG: hypothetical protein AAGE84_19610 [Cyanobacteria bacterium P01_G01_bin.39]
MELKANGMRFKFENKHYVADMTAREISGDSVAGSKNHNLPIKLPDGRFIKIGGWRRSSPPKPRPNNIKVVNDNGFEKYAMAKIIGILD